MTPLLLQKIADELNLAYPAKQFEVVISKNTAIVPKFDCFVIVFGENNKIKIGLKVEYATYFCYLPPDAKYGFTQTGENVVKYAQGIISLIEGLSDAFQMIRERAASDSNLRKAAIHSARTIALAVESLIDKNVETFPVRFATKEDLHRIEVSGDNHIHIETFGITLEQALKIIEILQVQKGVK